MSAIDTTALIVSICTIVAFATGSIKWLTKHYFDEIKAEFKPNGGSSLRDQVDRLEVNNARLEKKIDHITDILISHIDKTSNK
jgi:hypothetical protein